jgi:hypothetical protein
LHLIPFFQQSANGFFLTREDANASYVIVLHNVRTYRSGGVVAIVRGREKAESALKQFQEAESSSSYHEGWRYFIEKTDLAVGTDPAEATNLRQAELERRESKAPQETTPPVRPSSNPQK